VTGIRMGTAGWNVPKYVAAALPVTGCHPERYAQVFQALAFSLRNVCCRRMAHLAYVPPPPP
jgi:hypothetical protein